jgi:hypothetical protein
MTADNIDPARFRNAGGFVSYEPFGGGLYMALNIAFLDNANKRLFCSVSLAPTTRVYLWDQTRHNRPFCPSALTGVDPLPVHSRDGV